MISAKARCKRDTQRFWNRIKKRDATSGCELFVSKKGTRLKRGSRVFKHKGKLWIVSRLLTALVMTIIFLEHKPTTLLML